MTEKSWVYRLFLNAYLDSALIKYRAKTGYGKSVALFNLLNEKLYELGFMDEKGYQYNKERYGRVQIDEFEKQLEIQNQTVRLEIQQKKLEIQQLTRKLTNAFNQWDTMKESSKPYFIREAKANPELRISQEILKKAKLKQFRISGESK